MHLSAQLAQRAALSLDLPVGVELGAVEGGGLFELVLVRALPRRRRRLGELPLALDFAAVEARIGLARRRRLARRLRKALLSARRRIRQLLLVVLPCGGHRLLLSFFLGGDGGLEQRFRLRHFLLVTLALELEQVVELRAEGRAVGERG